MKVAISQPRYLPALNYLQRIQIADIFVILDNVQHQRRAFEHRNKIKSPNGDGVWCSMHLQKESSRPLISTLKVADPEWIKIHKGMIESYYKNAQYFDQEVLDFLYKDIKGESFLENVMQGLRNVCEFFGIEHHFVFASELGLQTHKDQLLYDITKAVGGTQYISGPNGRDYIRKNLFTDIVLLFHEYTFPCYRQLYGTFIPWMSIVDQLFNCSPQEIESFIFRTPELKAH